MSDQAESFWAFSLEIYGRPGVPEALVAFQDARGADINLLLYCCWHAATGRGGLDRTTLAGLREKVAAWRAAVVEPLRDIRRGMKGGIAGAPPDDAEALRGEVQRLEIEAERIEQALLATEAASSGRRDDTEADVRASLAAYCELLGAGAAGEAEAAVEVLLGAAFSATNGR